MSAADTFNCKAGLPPEIVGPVHFRQRLFEIALVFGLNVRLVTICACSSIMGDRPQPLHTSPTGARRF